MAVYRNGLTNQINLFVMEPAEEMAAIRFIKEHKPPAPVRVDYTISLEDQAKRLNLKGGYGIDFSDFHGLNWENRW
jgi:hypothetical protein